MADLLHSCSKCRRVFKLAPAAQLCDKCREPDDANAFLDDVPTVPRIVMPLRELLNA